MILGVLRTHSGPQTINAQFGFYARLGGTFEDAQDFGADIALLLGLGLIIGHWYVRVLVNGILDLSVRGVESKVVVVERFGCIWRWFRRSRRGWKRRFVCLADTEEGNGELRICWYTFEDCAVQMLDSYNPLSACSVLTS